MKEREHVELSELTTLRVGGRARQLVEAESERELVETVGGADSEGRSVLLVAGGSNLLIADEGWDGLAVAVRFRGVELEPQDGGVRLVAAAGEPWDELVARTVAEGLAGFECLSGIPGSTGATPIQNVGAYGQEVAETIVSVRAYDRERRETVELAPDDCDFGYRTSRFKRSDRDRFLILAVDFLLERSESSRPIAYGQLADALRVAVGERAPLGEVRETVLTLRRGKGMVLDPDDPDSTSAGSFFTNPILSAAEHERLRDRVRERLGPSASPPSWPEGEGQVKTSAAWLIERAGYGKGYGSGRAGVSGKHSLALVNRGGASADELVALARELRDGVAEAFGVSLEPEPTLVGVEL